MRMLLGEPVTAGAVMVDGLGVGDVDVYKRQGPYITKMSQKKIHQIIAGFGKAAVLAKQAGFDLSLIHI